MAQPPKSQATRLLDSGAAWTRFQAICEAQGGLRAPGVAPLREAVLTEQAGYVCGIHNRHLARVAKLAGAPSAATAGIELHVKLGDYVRLAMPLFTLLRRRPGNWPTQNAISRQTRLFPWPTRCRREAGRHRHAG